ncbi:MAG TPA: DUF1214 domain-containing protein, partial [Stellaceae bacterium]
VPNPIKRYSVGSETGLTVNPDGSIDILLQNTVPAALQSNWLPTPVGAFDLTLRFYWPEQAILRQPAADRPRCPRSKWPTRRWLGRLSQAIDRQRPSRVGHRSGGQPKMTRQTRG